MKKVIMLALVVLASASFSTICAKEKKDKKKQKAVAEQPVELKSDVDSLSYSIGMVQTQGLIDYLVMQLNVDTTYMADFISGLREGASGSDKQKNAFYAGIQIGQQIANQMVTGINKQLFGADTTQTISKTNFLAGFVSVLEGKKTLMTMHEAQDNAQRLMQDIKNRETEKLYGENREAGRKFLAENRLKEGVMVTPSGLQYKVLKQGEGAVPQATDKVKVIYEGRLIDGTVFDASAKHGSGPVSFVANQLIKGWTEALTMMPVGSKWQLFIPYQLAYGERNSGQIKPFSALVFDLELVEIEK